MVDCRHCRAKPTSFRREPPRHCGANPRVIPAKAGIQRGTAGDGVVCFSLDTRVRGYDVGQRGYDGIRAV